MTNTLCGPTSIFTMTGPFARYGMVEFNVPLDTVQVISKTGGGALSSDVHLSFSNGGPAT